MLRSRRHPINALLLMPLKFVDPKGVLDESEKWGKLYTEIVVRQSR